MSQRTSKPAMKPSDATAPPAGPHAPPVPADEPPAADTQAETANGGPGNPGAAKTPSANRINLFEEWGDQKRNDAPLELVRLGTDEVAVIPFTNDVVAVSLHYCDAAEIQGYVTCGGTGCVLCRAGKKPDQRMLLPVYLPASQSVGVLPISPVSRPGSLRPQIMPILRSGKRVALLISKPDKAKFTVATVELTEGMDDGAQAIKAFMGRWEANEVDLTSVFPKLDNRDLAEIPSVAAMLQLKGVTVDAVNQR